ncbi:phosphatase PAP2 family protein [Fulvivirga sediminis]|uniref:Phosphatase PAP2 family protein n=1 Tax=Fulvivirga sediminis TaxID=2803949 RepID=A0A937JYS4_9BACT|nr:phosphatase PAP2 family protein [Fulvivirga sediminis]MBL3655959.1 phosphatase PAP2 family protein [Fulvivirga sediminis]
MSKVRINVLLLLMFGWWSSVSAQNSMLHTRYEADSAMLLRNVELKRFNTSLKTSAVLVGAGFLALTNNNFLSSVHIAEERNENMPNFRVHVDDYLQYAPAAVVYGLNLAGVKGKNNFGDRTAILLKSELIMMAIVFPSKELTHHQRPDGSNHQSFPSGHTAQAFAAATFLHKEYGHLSPLYSIVAYASATAVGALRVMNNKHYTSDVLVGAGVGILATNLAYLTHQYRWSGRRKSKSKSTLSVMPVYKNKSLGVNMSLKLN